MRLSMLMDGTNMAHRIFWVVSERKNTKGQFVVLFLQHLRRLVDQFKPDRVYFCWDKKLDERTLNFREYLLNEYKANRVRDEKIELIHAYIDFIIPFLAALGITNLYPKTLECDDIVCWLNDSLEGKKIIISTDKDLYQLISPTTTVFSPVLKKSVSMENFVDETGVTPAQYLVYRAIKGDGSDNISGIKGYGEVRSKRIVENWDGGKKLPSGAMDIVKRNLKLMNLRLAQTICPEEGLSYESQLKAQDDLEFNPDVFKALCEQHNVPEAESILPSWEKVMSSQKMASALESFFS